MKLYRAVVLAGLLMMVLPAVAAVRNATIQITVLDSDTRSVVLDGSGVPKNCDMVNYDAYCHNSIATLITHTLLVKVGNMAPFKVSCRVDSVWSHCSALHKGQTFDAKQEKRGVSVYVLDEKGKLRQQLYSYVDDKAKRKDAPSLTVTSAPVGDNPTVQTLSNVAATTVGDTDVKCGFTSIPAGAEISLDGHYVGSTPSTLNVRPGDHTVEVSLPGFVIWKRSLTVSAGSEVTVNAILQKLE